jgi:DNA/RNA endonuclease YhcR with UshA esterase domain
MSLGIIEVITVLMGLSGFSVQNNPKAPTADQALEYAVADADIVAHFDATSVIPGNYKVLMSLQNNPQIKASPELTKAVKKAIAEIDGPRAFIKGQVGIDLATDIADATAFLRIVPKQDPNVVVAVHGKFKPDAITKLAKMVGKGAVSEAGGTWVDTGDGNAVGLTKGGVLLAGTNSLVKERLAPTWQKPALTAGNLPGVVEVINAKPVFAVFISLSQTARAEALANMQGQNFVTDVIKRHKLAAFAVFHDGIGWTWVDNNKGGLDAMTQISEGTIEILRAAQIAPRGFAKIVMGALESYKGTNKQIDEVIKRKADIQKIVESYSGDGNFKAQVDKDPAKLTLKVRLSGKSLSEVLPAGGFLPFGAIAWLTLGGKQEATQQIVAPPLPPPAPKKGATPQPATKSTPPKKP